MTRRRFSLAIASAAGIPAVRANAQTPASDPRFEVASLKPTPPDNQGGGIIRPMPGNIGYVATNMPLRTYFMIAYTIRDTQISNAPAWFGTDRYDLNAKAEKSSTIEELHTMLANLLADRCQLKFRKEGKEVSGYSLVVDKGGPKLTEHDAADKDYPPIRGIGPGKIQGTNANMEILALFIARGLDGPVIDKTGLTAHYDYTLEVIPSAPPTVNGDPLPAGPPQPPDAGMVNDALRAQLGLRLDKTKVTAYQYIIEHVEKPSEN